MTQQRRTKQEMTYFSRFASANVARFTMTSIVLLASIAVVTGVADDVLFGKQERLDTSVASDNTCSLQISG